MYEKTVDDLIITYMHIANYISWLTCGSTGKGFDSILKIDEFC